MKTTATMKDACRLIQEGNIALADVEANGIKIDMDYCQRTHNKLEKRIEQLKAKLEKDPIVKKWKKIYGTGFKWDGNNQLADILFNHFDYEAVNKTKTGKPSTDEESLRALNVNVVNGLIKLRKYTKMKNTYIKGLMREAVNGILHPIFKLNTVTTFRSSSSNPNFQNMPIRDPEMGKMIRQALIPRAGHRIMEFDYSGIEVRIAACYHKDPVMLEYINDKSKDMHRDMAAECYKLSTKQVTKATRHCGKNMFVFPQFYGDYYENCAKALWDAVPTLTLPNKKPMIDHLRNNGLKTLKAFIRHIETVEDRFWNDRFSVYTAWKDKWYNRYLQNGYFDMKTGFRCNGLMKRNEVINYPVQGAAFHCLLSSLIKVNKELRHYKMNTIIIGQIHDSIVMDVDSAEYQNILELCHRVMCDELRQKWDWIIVPIEIEAEATPIDGSWYEKKEVI